MKMNSNNENNKNSDVELLAKIQRLCDLFDEIDDTIDSNGERLQKTDFMLSDLEHTLENDELSDIEILNVGKKIKNVREIRRSLRNEYEIIKKYKELKVRLPEKGNRAFFRSNMNITVKNLNQPYKNRVYTDDEITNIKSIQKNVEKTSSEIETTIVENIKKLNGKTKLDLEKLVEEYNKGVKQVELAKMFNCTQPLINQWLKKIGIKKGKKKKNE